MVRSKSFRGGIHSLMLVEEPADIARKLAVASRPGSVKRSGGLSVCRSYLLPPLRASRDECRQCCLAARYRDGLFVGAPIRIRYLATSLPSETGPYLDQRHARPGDSSPARPSRCGFGSHATRAQLARKAFTETIELNGTRIEPCAIQPLGLNRQMDMRAWCVGMEGQDIIVIVTQLGMGQCADGSQHFVRVSAFGH